jgi:hypothetical protein
MSLNEDINGLKAIGREVYQVINGKHSVFKAFGKVVGFKKIKDKGAGSGAIKVGRYLIHFSDGKKYWRRRSDFKIL